MSKTKLLFCCSHSERTLEVFRNNQNEITVWINQPSEHPVPVSLDKVTSVKLVKTLKLEISKIVKEEWND